MRGWFLILFMFLSFEARANSMCSVLFGFEERVSPKAENERGNPRYYTVRNYTHHKRSDLAQFLDEIRNLTQFADRMSDLSTFIRDTTFIPSEAFFVANRMIPLIESFLKDHGVEHRIETHQKSDGVNNTIKRSLIVISEVENNTVLNRLASKLGLEEKQLLVVDPIELFFGYEHYNQSQGKSFDIDAYSPAYAISFYLLLHSVRKDFDFSIMQAKGRLLKTDPDLHHMTMENPNIRPSARESNEEEGVRVTPLEESLAKDRQERERKLNERIEALKRAAQGQ